MESILYVLLNIWLIFHCMNISLYNMIILSFTFCFIEVQLINNVVLVSGVQQSDSVVQIHVSILFQILFPLGLLHNFEQSSLYCAEGPCWLSISNISVGTCFQPLLMDCCLLFAWKRSLLGCTVLLMSPPSLFILQRIQHPWPPDTNCPQHSHCDKLISQRISKYP